MSSATPRLRRGFATVFDASLLAVSALFIMLATGLMESAEAYEMPQPIIRILGLTVVSYLLLYGYTLLTSGQTLGKRLFGLRVESADGGPLSAPRHALRSALVFTLCLAAVPVSLWLVLLIVVIDSVAIFGAEGRCLHDYAAGSRVVSTTGPG